VTRNVAGELLFAKKNVVAKLALLLKACGSAVRDARRKWRELKEANLKFTIYNLKFAISRSDMQSPTSRNRSHIK